MPSIISMRKSVTELTIEKIEMAWQDVAYPGDENIFTPHSYDDEDITEYFSGTTWKGHSIAELRAHCGAISVFFTPVAYHYWLPAYLIAAIEDPEELDVCLISLVDSFRPETEAAMHYANTSEKLALLTNDQKLAVIATLEIIVEQFESQSYPANDEIEALKYIRSITNLA